MGASPEQAKRERVEFFKSEMGSLTILTALLSPPLGGCIVISAVLFTVLNSQEVLLECLYTKDTYLSEKLMGCNQKRRNLQKWH